MANQTLDIFHPSTTLKWEECPSLPVGMSDASSVYLNRTLYVGGGFTDEPGSKAESALYSFKLGVDSTWTVTDTPTYWYTLVAHDSELLLVGGRECSTDEITNEVFTMRDGQFVKVLPSMKEKRTSPSAVSSGSALVVAGGYGTSENLSSVEVLKDGQWTTAPSLPSAGFSMKSALHGGQWYLIQQEGKVFHATLQSLVSSIDKLPWESLPDAPNEGLAAAFFGGHLLSIGAGDNRNQVTAIHAFSSIFQSWEHVSEDSDLLVQLVNPTAIVLSSDQLILINQNEVFHGQLIVNPFDVDSQFTVRDIDCLKPSAGISLIEELVQHTPTAFPVVAGVNVRAMYNLILREWESGRGSRPPTWTELFRALEEMGLSELAGRMEKYLRGLVPEDRPRPPPDEEDGTPEQNKKISILAENTLLKETNQHLEEQLARLKSAEEQLGPVKKERSSDKVKCEEPVSQLPPLGLSTTQHHAIPFNLPGVEVVANTFVIVTNSPQTFHWDGYGFSLHVPQGSLPAGVDQCRLDIKASVAGQYQFPDNLQLVSSVFWMRPHPSGRFQQQLTVEIQHCAKMTSSISTKLSFVRAHCSQECLPYTFKQLEGRGSFTEHSSYGCLSVNHFSSYAIAAEGDVDLQYVASLYYLKADPRSVEIHFTVNVDDEVHNAETRKHFDMLGAKEKLSLGVEFDTEFDNSTISLDVPLSSGIDINEWSLLPLVTPKISKKRVDSFKPGRKVPSTILLAILSESSWNRKVPRRSHLITLKGTKDPDNQIRIVLDPVDPKEGLVRLSQVINSMSVVAVSNPPGSQVGQPIGASEQSSITVAEIVRHVGISEEDLDRECSNEQLQKIGTFLPYWPKFAEALLLTNAQITGIQNNPNIDYEMKAEKVLELWHRRDIFKATYRRLVEICLLRFKDGESVEKICLLVKANRV